MEKIELEIVKRLIMDYGIDLARLKEQTDFVHAIIDFFQYVGANQYYSDLVNKKIFLLSLDADSCLLQLEGLKFTAGKYRKLVLSDLVKKKKSAVDPVAAKDFAKKSEELEAELHGLLQRTLDLTGEIRHEYKQKQQLA